MNQQDFPLQALPIQVTRKDERTIVMRFGYVPHGARMLNADVLARAVRQALRRAKREGSI